MRIPLVLIAGVIVAAGCAGDPPAAALAPSAKPPSTLPAWMKDLDAVDRVEPILGRWTIDLDATVQANSALPEVQLSALANDLREHPFSLEITNERYISRSRDRTIADRYEPLGYDDDGYLWLSLSPATNDPAMAVRPTTDPAARSAQRGRRAVLRVRGDQLWIKAGATPDAVVVMRRIGRPGLAR